MDDHNFQQQLHALNHRVAQLSISHQPSQDPFTHQLSDLKAHVASMEAFITNYRDHNFLPQKPIAVPSGPLYWQLYTSLRTDVQGIDKRVATLEQGLLDLEDRIDRLEPPKFTPASSTTSSDEMCTNAWNGSIPVGSQSASAPNPRAESIVASFGNDGWSVAASSPSQTKYPNILQVSSDSTFDARCAHAGPLQCVELSRSGEIHPANQNAASLRSNVASTATMLGQLHEQNSKMEDHIGRLDVENDKLSRAIQTLAHSTNYKQLHEPVAAISSTLESRGITEEGVAFRDREIARLDEQLRKAQQALAMNETTKSSLLARAHTDRDNAETYARDLEKRNSYFKQQLVQHRDNLQSNSAEIADLRNQVTERGRALRGWQDSWNGLKEAHREEQAKVRALERVMHEVAAERRAEIEQIVADHDKEMKKLKDFCEQKDTVIQKQEEIIDRGGRLLEQRDGEIEDMQRRLRAADDDREHARRTQVRHTRLLEERDAEIARLKGDVSSAAKPSVSENSLPSISSSIGTNEGQQEMPSHGWGARSPRPYQRHNSGDRRARFWDDAAQSSARRSRPERSLTRSSYMPMSTANEGLNAPRQTQDGVVTQQEPTAANLQSSEQSRQASNDSTLRPPLPAPVTARRMASEADLRGPRTHAQRALSKHQSMQELPKRPLQPYVETDAEE